MQGNYFTGFISHLDFIGHLNNGWKFENNYCNIYLKELELSI